MAYKPVTYNGYKIEFVKEYGNVYARCPALIRNQFIGSGKTKAIAQSQAQATINRVVKANPRKRRQSNRNLYIP